MCCDLEEPAACAAKVVRESKDSEIVTSMLDSCLRNARIFLIRSSVQLIMIDAWPFFVATFRMSNGGEIPDGAVQMGPLQNIIAIFTTATPPNHATIYKRVTRSVLFVPHAKISSVYACFR